MIFRRAATHTALIILVGVTLAAGALAAWLFPRALPTIVLSHRITRDEALQRADAFFRAHDIAPPRARTAVRFRQDDSLMTFVDLVGGGRDTLDALARGRDVAIFTWSVRAFTPRDQHEARVHFTPDGRVTGFERRFAETDTRPELSADSARRVAEHVLTNWLGETPARWRLAASSYAIQKASARVDHTFTFERTERRIAGAPIRLDIVVAGDAPSLAKRYVVIPESFRRRHNEMRSANQLLTLIDAIGVLVIVVAGAVALRRFARGRQVRWRAPFITAAVIAVLLIAAGMNELPLAWYDYDTAMSPATYRMLISTGALAGGVLLGVVVAITLAAAEVASREAFPRHLDWWGFWKHRGTREVAGRVAGGYAVAAISLAYVASFYLVARRLFGWWVPAELLDDPNQIATSMPWITGVAISVQAAVWEEALFRALPLSLLSLWVGSRPRRGLWMAAGVVATAIVFGFGHADYPSWPPYSRGVEIFVDACFWGVLFLQFGFLVTVVAHFLYDLTLFGLFAATGTGLAYRVSAVMIAFALLAPAIAVAWRWALQRKLPSAPDEARFGAWRPAEHVAPEQPALTERESAGTIGARARTVGMATAAIAVLVALLAPRAPVLGPRFAVSRATATAAADSVMRGNGVEPSGWTRLTNTAQLSTAAGAPGMDSLAAWPRFLVAHKSEALAESLATTYAIPAWWIVRYVHPQGSLSARVEEWRVRVRPDGVPIDVRHIVPDSAPGATPTPAEARRIARAALARAGLDTSSLRETRLQETARPARHDVTVTYTDSTIRLPGGAAARVWVSLAGTQPVLVRRGVELPEQFLREDRDRRMTRLLIAALGAIGLLSAVSLGAWFLIRRRQPMPEETDFAMSRRALLGVIAGLGVLTMAESVNNLPSVLAEYVTAVPWSTFLTSQIVGLIASTVFFVLVLAGLWLAANALRRRVGGGIPVFPRADSALASNDAIVAGVALGSLVAIAQLVSGAVGSGVPPAPETALNQIVPGISGVISLPTFVLGMVPVIAIPPLVIGGLARRTRYQVLLSLVLLALLAVIAVPLQRPTTPRTVVLSAAAVVALWFGIRSWGPLCAVAWVVAALANRALMALHVAIHPPSAPEQLTAALAVLASLALLWYLMRLSRRRRALGAPRLR
jgi:hypothetical protein